MRLFGYIFAILSATILTVGCGEDRTLVFPEPPEKPVTPPDKPDDPDDPELPGEPVEPLPGEEWGDERDFVFDMEALPEIRVTVPLDEWNALLAEYDSNNKTDMYIRCRAEFTTKGERYEIADAGLRLKGNTSRRRPEQGGGSHRGEHTEWNHCHFMLNLHKFVKDEAHTVRGVRKLHLKWFKDDSSYCREIYCYDLFRRYGVWTAAMSSYCRLWLRVEGDAAETYYGVYAMLEAVDDRFVKMRKERFGSHRHNLWKCRYGASLNFDRDAGARIGFDDGSGQDYTYELKTNTENFAAAKAQLLSFMRQLTSRTGRDFHDWIAQVCDVELLLRTYAVNVAVGMWDDYWNNTNNFYIYFNSDDPDRYEFFFIPYDYDNTLGTSSSCGVQDDSARHPPLEWGDTSVAPLIGKLLAFDDYRKIYVDALYELCDPAAGLLYYESSIGRIRRWQAAIAPYVENDTGQDMRIEDRPAAWGNRQEYRLLDPSPNTNFFRLKAASLPAR